MRLIDADALIEDIKTVNPIMDDKIEWGKRIVNAAPTIDPVRHGYWKETDNPMFRACSVCGYLEWKGLWNNYCPKCGAKMDGGKDEESEE